LKADGADFGDFCAGCRHKKKKIVAPKVISPVAGSIAAHCHPHSFVIISLGLSLTTVKRHPRHDFCDGRTEEKRRRRN